MSLVLGLGTNLGDRLANLRTALTEIKKLPITVQQVSPVYISDALLPENAPASWNKHYLNIAIRCQTSLSPHQLLKALQEIEQKSGRPVDHEHWGPRVIDIDILCWNNEMISDAMLTIPHAHLLKRPFALWPLADVAPFWIHPHEEKTAAQLVEYWGSRFSGEAPFKTRQIMQRIEGSQLVGILNVTPDSFSDGGRYVDPEKAFQHAMQMMDEGAEVIDIGAESSSPTAAALTWQEEWSRLEPVLKIIDEERHQFVLPPKISIDTRHAQTAMHALAYNIDWLNDVSGFDDINMQKIAADSDVDLVVMHHLSIPERRTNVLPRNIDPVKAVIDWGSKRIEELTTNGIEKERIIFDPGIGFGKMAEQSLAIFKNVSKLDSLGVRSFIGHSRKTFLALLTGKPAPERDLETTVASLYLAKQGVEYLRVHNVNMHARALKVMAELNSM